MLIVLLLLFLTFYAYFLSVFNIMLLSLYGLIGLNDFFTYIFYFHFITLKLDVRVLQPRFKIMTRRYSFFARKLKHDYCFSLLLLTTAPLWTHLFQPSCGTVCHLGLPIWCSTITCKLKQKPCTTPNGQAQMADSTALRKMLKKTASRRSSERVYLGRCHVQIFDHV